MANSLKIYVGWDSREPEAYVVCEYSIRKRASKPVEIVPLKQQELRESGVYTREVDKFSSTEFSFTRFLTPYLAGFKGWALFVDSDFLYLSDIAKLFDLADDTKAIMCVQHDYRPKESVKMDGQVQTAYPRKNWSSMVLYNCGHPANKVLTPDIVNSETGLFLHRFLWLDDSLIGELPISWNWLEGWYETSADTMPDAVHFTRGGPWFQEWRDVEFGDLWVREYEEAKARAAD